MRLSPTCSWISIQPCTKLFLSSCLSVVSETQLDCLSPTHSLREDLSINQQERSVYTYRISDGPEDWEGQKTDAIDFKDEQEAVIGMPVSFRW